MSTTYDYLIAPKASFDATANAIREIRGSVSPITWTQEGFANAIGTEVHTLEDALVTKTIVTYSNDRITETGNSAFQGNTNLQNISLPNITKLGKYTFNDCSSLTVVVFPKVQILEQACFQRNSSLTKVDLGSAKEMLTNSQFNNCSKLTTLILRGDTVCSIANVDAFYGSAFRNNTVATLYVKESLIDAYKTATNWSSFINGNNNQVLAIEGSIYENAYADGTPIGGMP